MKTYDLGLMMKKGTMSHWELNLHILESHKQKLLIY